MKRIYQFLAIVATVLGFAACADVPAPYELNTTTEVAAEPAGEGTVSDPYNVIKALNIINNGEYTDSKVYVKGIVSKIDDADFQPSYGNLTYYISDSGKKSNQLEVYRGYGINGAKFASVDELAVGDTVIVYGVITMYSSTAEFTQGSSIVYQSGKTDQPNGGGDEPVVTGDNLLANGDFEAWAGGLPTNWKSASTASNADLSQSTDAHGGSYAVKVGYNETQNKRLAYKELTLKKGTYEFSFYAKATTSASSQCQPGWVAVTDGKVGNYNYLGYESLSTTWTLISKTFTLDAETTVCLVVMNPKTSSYATAQDILIDDAALKTNDGGIVDGGGNDEPTPPAGDVEHITIAEFLAKADPNTTYELTGVVKNITSTTYGNFDLEDETGSVFIYGLLDKDGQAKNFANMGIAEGDEVTLTGKYYYYEAGSKAEIQNAQFISVKKGNGGGDDPNPDPDPDPTPSGDNLLANGDFEAWSGGLPTNWKSASTASNADLSQSTDAHGGSYAVKVGFNATQNKRLAYKELALEAGKYKFQFYAKATTADASQCQPGWVAVTDGKVGNYNYLGYQSINNSEWTLVTGEFELNAATTVCLVVMNPKTSSYATAQDILIDDATLVKQ